MPREPLDAKNVKAAMTRLFESRDGKIVMEYLTRKYYDAPIKDASVMREVGRRDVLLRIKTMTREDTSHD